MSTKLRTLTLDLVAKISNFSEPMKKAGDTAQVRADVLQLL